MLAAHDAGQRQRPATLGFVGDQRGPGRRRDGLLVEQQQLLARLGQAHMDRTRKLRVVEGVQRLAQLEHHVVGDIDERRDGTHAAALDALLHPVGRGCLRIHATHDAATVAWTGGRCVEDDATRFLMHGGDRLDHWQRQRRAGQGGHFARDTGQRQAVGTVRRELQRNQVVVEVQVLADAQAKRRVVRQRQQAAVVFREAQLAG